MNVIFFLAFVMTFVAIGVGMGIYFAEKSRDTDADIARFILSIPPDAFEPDELWRRPNLPPTPGAHRPGGPRSAQPPIPPSGVGGTPLYGPQPRPDSL